MAKLDNMAKARTRLLLNHPFFASLIMSSPYVMTTDVPTAATDGKKLYFNPDFMDSLTLEENMGVQCHEVLHDALLHVMRLWGRDRFIWNVACDYTINKIVLDAGLKLPKGCLIDDVMGKNSADVNYEILMKKVEDERKKRKERGDKGDGQPKPGDQQGQGDPQDGQGGNVPSPGGSVTDPSQKHPGIKPDILGQDMKEPEGNENPADRAKREQEIRQRVAQAANMARMAGKLPGSLERFINEVLNPQVPWQDYLREYMTKVTKADESWAKRNRRFSDVYLPTRHSERMGEIAVIGDTSGSIGAEELNKVGAEIRGIADDCNPERIRVLWADTKVANEQVFEGGEALLFQPGGGGGTDMRVPLAHVEQYEPEVVILITDGYTPWPKEEPPYPLIVVCTTNAPVPVGQVVRIK